MKTILYSLLFVFLSISSLTKAQESLPYNCNFSNQAEFNTYQCLNNGAGTNNWDYSSSQRAARFYENSSNLSAWLISPSFHLEKGKTYQLKFQTKRSGSAKNLKVAVGKGDDLDSYTTILQDLSVSFASFTTLESLFNVEESGEWNIGFNCYGSGDRNDLYVTAISLVEIPNLPVKIESLEIIPDSEESLFAEIKWTNPSVAVSGKELESLTKIELYREEGLIHTINNAVPGAEESYTDEVPEAGKYTYKVIAFNEDGESEPTQATSDWIGSSTMTIPYACFFDTQEEFELFTLINNSTGTNNWTYSSSSKRVSFYGSETNADKWIISPKLALEANKTYKLTFKTWLENAGTTSYKNLKVTIGEGADLEAQTTILFNQTINHTAQNTYEVLFGVDQNGKWNIGFNCYGQSNFYDIYLDDIEVVEIPTLPAAPTDLIIKPAEDESLSAQISWTNPSKTNAGLDLTTLTKVVLYREEQVIYTQENPVIGGEENFMDEVPQAGKYTYKVIAYNEEGESEAVARTSEWIGSKTVTLPYTSSFTPNDNHFDLYTILDENNDNKTWGWDGQEAIKYDSYSVPNDWLFTPPFIVEAGKYKLTFEWKTGHARYEEELNIILNKSANPKEQGIVLNSEDNRFVSTYYSTTTIEFQIEENDKYQIGFHLFSSSPWGMYIKDIQIEYVPPTVPDSATNLMITPDENELLSAEISWINPEAASNSQGSIPLSKVELYRNEQLVYDNDNPVAEAEESFTDNVPEAGKYTYRVIVYNEEGASEPIEAISAWIGPKEMTLPYTSSFTEESNDFDIYTVINADGNSVTWEWDGEISIKHATSGSADDWLFTPSFMGEPGNYKLTFRYKTLNGILKEEMDITLGTTRTPEEQISILDKEDHIFSSGLYTKKEVVFTIEKDEETENNKYYIGFHLYTSGGSSEINLTEIELEILPIFNPEKVSDLTIIPASDESLTAEISWVNPSVDIEKGKLPKLTKTELYRNNSIIYTNESPEVGIAESYSDELPKAGKYTYKVIVYHEEDASEPVEILSSWIGPKEVVLPYNSSFTEEKNDFDLYTILNLDENSTTWEIKDESLYHGTTTSTDDWAITPYFKAVPGNYRLTFYWRTFNGIQQDEMDISFGKSRVPADHISILPKEEHIFSAGLYNKKEIVFTIEGEEEKEELYCLGFHLYTSGGAWGMYIRDIEIEHLSIVIPDKITDLSIIPSNDEALSAEISWLNPTTTIEGGKLPKLTKSEIYRDGEIIHTNTSPNTGEKESYTDEVTKAGKYTYKVIVYHEEEEGEAVELTSSWIGPKEVTLPYTSSFTETTNDFDLFTVVDVNGDGVTWIWNEEDAISYEEKVTADEWIFTPYFENSITGYHISFKWKSGNPSTSEMMDITLGSNKNITEHTYIINEGKQTFNGGDTYQEIQFEIDLEGKKIEKEERLCFGFHLYTTESKGISIKDIHIKENPIDQIQGVKGDTNVSYDRTNSTLLFTNPDQISSLTITSLTGMPYLKSEITENSLNISSFPTGVYIIEWYDVEHTKQVMKISKK